MCRGLGKVRVAWKKWKEKEGGRSRGGKGEIGTMWKKEKTKGRYGGKGECGVEEGRGDKGVGKGCREMRSGVKKEGWKNEWGRRIKREKERRWGIEVGEWKSGVGKNGVE